MSRIMEAFPFHRNSISRTRNESKIPGCSSRTLDVEQLELPEIFYRGILSPLQLNAASRPALCRQYFDYPTRPSGLPSGEAFANIILTFQPSHSPETNPIEQVWLHLKRGLRWKVPRPLDELRLLMRERLQEMTQAVIRSIVGRASLLEVLSVAGL